MISDYPKTNLAAANRGESWILSGPVTRRPELVKAKEYFLITVFSGFSSDYGGFCPADLCVENF